jgi:hypothetical protein
LLERGVAAERDIRMNFIIGFADALEGRQGELVRRKFVFRSFSPAS